MQDLEAWIKKCEGLRLTPYADTLGHLTIGYGRNLEKGITAEEAQYLFLNDLKSAIDDLSKYEWFNVQPENVKYALINMVFNLGIKEFLLFKKMIANLKEKKYSLAALEVLNSTWAKQVGNRAKDVANMIREGH